MAPGLWFSKGPVSGPHRADSKIVRFLIFVTFTAKSEVSQFLVQKHK